MVSHGFGGGNSWFMTSDASAMRSFFLGWGWTVAGDALMQCDVGERVDRGAAGQLRPPVSAGSAELIPDVTDFGQQFVLFGGIEFGRRRGWWLGRGRRWWLSRRRGDAAGGSELLGG